MSAYATASPAAYQQQSIMTAPPERLVVMLYDGAIRFFFQAAVLPTLPLADASVDVVYAGSVFTHTGDFEEAWLLELRRVLRPEGFALLTFHSERTWDDMRDPSHGVTQTVTGPRHRAEPIGLEPLTADLFGGEMPAPRVVMYQPDVAAYDTITVHSGAWLRERWFELEQVIERAHGDHQDAAVLRPR